MKTILYAGLLLCGLAQNVSAEIRTVTLLVPGMSCPTCPITIRKALKQIDGVNHIQIDYDSKTATVTFDDEITAQDQLTAATNHAGYPSEITSRTQQE